MCDPATLTLIAVGTAAASGGVSAYSQYQEGVAANQYYNSEAQQSEAEGAAALTRADRQSTAIQDTAKLEGKKLEQSQARFNATQRAILAANGVQGVTTDDIANDTFNTQDLDKRTQRYNADVNSYEVNEEGKYINWAARNEANQFRAAGKNAKRAGKIGAFSTLLGTASSIAGSFATAGGGGKKTQSQTLGYSTKKYR